MAGRTNDEGPAVGAAGLLEQSEADAANSIESKLLRAQLAAEFALAGWTFTGLKSGGYMVGKWGRSRHVMDLAGAEAFLAEVQGAAR